MKKPLVLLTLLLVCFSGFTQNWRLFDPSRKYYYGHENATVDHMLRIDSFSVAGTDTLWYPSRTHKPDSLGNDSCWPFALIRTAFGAHIRQEPNASYHLVYGNGDTLHMNLAATAPWRAFTGHTQAYTGWINAIPLGKSVALTPLGTTDSITTIELRYFWANGVQHHSIQLQVGKLHGMFQLPLVPSMYNSIGAIGDYTWDSTLSLAGISNPDLGVQNIPRDRFFSMQPGDTVQIHTYDYDNGGEIYLWTWRQDIYLSRTLSVTGDTIHFQIDRSEYYMAHNRPTPPSFRTIVYEMAPLGSSMYQRLDRDLGETWAANEDASAWAWQWRIDQEFPDRIMKPMNLIEPYDTLLQCHTKLWTGIPIHDTFDKFYMDGLGGPYYSFAYPSFYEGFRRPIYFRIGGIAQGTPVAFAPHINAVTPPVKGPSFQIWPNPCENAFTLDLRAWEGPEPVNLEIISLQGQLLRNSVLDPRKVIPCSVEDLPKGIYFLRVSSSLGSQIQKLVRQ